MPPEGNLLSLQRRFMTALREPIFGDSRARSALPDRTGAVSAKFIETAEELITPSVSMNSMERLELYHRQYWHCLLDSMAEDFPALRQLLGDATFWQLIEAYLEATPPRSFTLRHLGADLAEFVASHPWLVPHPAHAEDLAHLEYVLWRDLLAHATVTASITILRNDRKLNWTSAPGTLLATHDV